MADDGKVFIARQDTLEEVQNDTTAIKADTAVILEETGGIKEETEKIWQSPKGLQVFIPANGSYACNAYSLGMNVNGCEFAEAGGKVHIFGNTQAKARQHYIFDPETGKMELQAELPYDFYGYGMAVGTDDGRVHLFGGSGGARKHWIWAAGEWTEGADLSDDFAHGCATAYGNDIFFISGATKKLYKWIKESNSNSYLSGLSGMTNIFYDGFLFVDNGYLVFGGGYDTENASGFLTAWKTKSLTNFALTAVANLPCKFRRASIASDGYGYIYKNFLCTNNGNSKHQYRLNGNVWEAFKIGAYDYPETNPGVYNVWRYVKDNRSFLFGYNSVYVQNYGWRVYLPKGTAILCCDYFYPVALRKKGSAYIVDKAGEVYIGTRHQSFLVDGEVYSVNSITFYIDGEETT